MHTQAKMFATVRSALTTAADWLAMGEDFPDRAWTDKWRAHCRKEAARKKADARWYLQLIRDNREWGME